MRGGEVGGNRGNGERDDFEHPFMLCSPQGECIEDSGDGIFQGPVR